MVMGNLLLLMPSPCITLFAQGFLVILQKEKEEKEAQEAGAMC